jgi:hypothetical protein
MRAMMFQSTTKFLLGSRWFLGSLQFLTDKFGNLSLQELKLGKVAGSGTGGLPPAPVSVGLVNEAQHEHELGSLGEMDTDPVEDKANHTQAAQTTAIDPICPPSSESNSVYDGVGYMVEQGGEPLEKRAEEIQREAEVEIARAEHFARELDKSMGHNGLQDDSGRGGGAWRMSLEKGFHQGDTTRSLTHSATLIMNDSSIGHDQSVRRLLGSSTRESRSTIC